MCTFIPLSVYLDKNYFLQADNLIILILVQKSHHSTEHCLSLFYAHCIYAINITLEFAITNSYLC